MAAPYVPDPATRETPVQEDEVRALIADGGRLLRDRRVAAHFLHRVQVTLEGNRRDFASLHRQVAEMRIKGTDGGGTAGGLDPWAAARFLPQEEFDKRAAAHLRAKLEQADVTLSEITEAQRKVVGRVNAIKYAVGELLEDPGVPDEAKAAFLRLVQSVPDEPPVVLPAAPAVGPVHAADHTPDGGTDTWAPPVAEAVVDEAGPVDQPDVWAPPVAVDQPDVWAPPVTGEVVDEQVVVDQPDEWAPPVADAVVDEQVAVDQPDVWAPPVADAVVDEPVAVDQPDVWAPPVAAALVVDEVFAPDGDTDTWEPPVAAALVVDEVFAPDGDSVWAPPVTDEAVDEPVAVDQPDEWAPPEGEPSRGPGGRGQLDDLFS